VYVFNQPIKILDDLRLFTYRSQCA